MDDPQKRTTNTGRNLSARTLLTHLWLQGAFLGTQNFFLQSLGVPQLPNGKPGVLLAPRVRVAISKI